LYRRTHWHIPVVEVTTQDGLVGTGYSGVWAGEDLLCDTVDRYIAPRITGADSSRIGELWSRTYWSDLHWVGRAGVAHMALGMVDTALWDLAAQRAETPLWRLLGGRHSTLPTYNTDGGWLNFSPDELIDDMSSMADAGWSWLKMKVGLPDLSADLDRVAKVEPICRTTSCSPSTSTRSGTCTAPRRRSTLSATWASSGSRSRCTPTPSTRTASWHG
jgi:L-alanine-DL-glutamate epimerase-like enolase superfamily enzyme